MLGQQRIYGKKNLKIGRIRNKLHVTPFYSFPTFIFTEADPVVGELVIEEGEKGLGFSRNAIFTQY